MNILLTILTPLVVGFGLAFIFSVSKKENKRKSERLNKKDFVARSSYTWGAIMATINTLIAVILIFANIDSPLPIGVNIFLGILFLLFTYGIVQAFRERVHIKDGVAVYTPALGKSKSYLLKDLDRVEKRKTGVYVYMDGKKVFVLDNAGIGTSTFLDVYRNA